MCLLQLSMPRFLDTTTGQFVWINNPQGVRYAILSHTWKTSHEGGEQTYDDIRRIQDTIVAEQGTLMDGSQSLAATLPGAPSPTPSIFGSPELSEKIRGFCAFARATGYDLAWADMCCIDKSSSAELSEAINSMYEWYRLATVCYVYLADVSDSDDPERVYKAFCESRWHTRGWTLQELLAPRRVVFLTRRWEVIGTKLGLAGILKQITGIDASILTGRANLSTASVAQRMSWAAQRETTRVEDRAYSLMGIFGVFMSPVYGEGRNAFLRLQEEIIKTIPDQSIFAWGSYIDIFAESHSVDVVTVGPTNDSILNAQLGSGLLAPSPLAFKYCSDIVPVPSAQFAWMLRTKRDSLPPLHCVFTPQGVSIQLPCIDTTSRRFYTRVKDVLGRPKSYGRLALLRCRVRDGPFIALPLSSKYSRGKNDYLEIDPAFTIHSTRGSSGLSVLGRTIRLARPFFEFARSRGWRLDLQHKLLLLASEKNATATYTDWGARAFHTLTKGDACPPVLCLAPWCDCELHSVGFTISAVSPSQYMHQADYFKPMHVVIAPLHDEYPDEVSLFDLHVEVTAEEWSFASIAGPITSDTQLQSQFSVTITHRRHSQGADEPEATVVLATRIRLHHVGTLSRRGAALYVERDFQIGRGGSWRRSPFHGRLFRIIIQNALPKKHSDGALQEPRADLSCEDLAEEERFWVSLEFSEGLRVRRRTHECNCECHEEEDNFDAVLDVNDGEDSEDDEDDDEDDELSGWQILLCCMLFCYYVLREIVLVCIRLIRTSHHVVWRTVLHERGGIRSADVASSHISVEGIV
ncbi:hypothetical protein C8Q70DRAFT_275407 [Cubamyces menziesii]|nr:hypothetical protein C8Q70DRAFT_275407 [Cubamyces menziesii]